MQPGTGLRDRQDKELDAVTLEHPLRYIRTPLSTHTEPGGMSMGRRKRWRRFAAGLTVSCGILLFVAPYDRHSEDLHLVREVIGSVAHGHLNGSNHQAHLPLTASHLEPGDILLCHNPGGGYGYWTHAGLYVGDGQVVDANDFVLGTVRKPLTSYRNYAKVMVLRVKTSLKTRQEAARFALGEVGRAYDPFSGLSDGHSEYCSKLVWESFAAAKVQLTPRHHWVLPDDLAHSPKVGWIETWE